MYPMDGLDCKSLVGTLRPLDGGTKRSGPSSPTSTGTPPITSPPVAKCPPNMPPFPKKFPSHPLVAQSLSLSIPSRPLLPDEIMELSRPPGPAIFGLGDSEFNRLIVGSEVEAKLSIHM